MKLLHFLLLLLAVCLVAGGVVGGQRLMEHNRLATAANKELAQQATELDECRARLKRFHGAWSKFRAAHGGSEPPTIEAFFPKYLRSPSDLLCPTAARWTKAGGMVDQGSIRVGKKNYPETYGFKWLAAGYSKMSESLGGSAPLITCGVHREVVYRATYKKAPPLGTFDSKELNKLVGPVAKTPLLAVRKNGQVGEISTDEL